MTVAKRAPWAPISGYASLTYSEWDGGFNIPFGLTAWIGDNFSLQPMYDGQRTHLMVNYSTKHVGFSLLWVWLEEPGLAISAGF